MPSREQTMADAVSIFRNAVYPNGLSAVTAWLGVYQALLWYEPVNCLGFTQLPHIIDADKLRPPSSGARGAWSTAKAWQTRAASFSQYLAEQLNCQPEQLPSRTDYLMRSPDYHGMQRQNILGTAFVGLIKHTLE